MFYKNAEVERDSTSAIVKQTSYFAAASAAS